MKIKVSACADADSSAIIDMTEDQYEFLKKLVKKVNAGSEGCHYAGYIETKLVEEEDI